MTIQYFVQTPHSTVCVDRETAQYFTNKGSRVTSKIEA
jgi:hypothetical protein